MVTARSRLLTVLGELVLPSGRPVWSSTLVLILKGLGIEEQAVRQAIARASASGWIIGERSGREVRWTVSPRLAEIFRAGTARVHSLSDPFSEWDGNWLTLLTSIPHERRSARRSLYSGLTWAGFGNPTPGLWVSPHPGRADEVGRLIADLELRRHTYSFSGTLNSIGLTAADIVRGGWDLTALEAQYRVTSNQLARLEPADENGVLLAHLWMIGEWQKMPRTDPQLPEALLPNWIGRTVARGIESRRARWAATVRARYNEINDIRTSD